MPNPTRPPSDDELRALYGGKRVLVTGVAGFVASVLVPRLAALGAEVFGIARGAGAPPGVSEVFRGDLREVSLVESALSGSRPDFVFHLAGQASVGTSWEREWETIEVNVKSAFTLLSELERMRRPARVLLVSTGEVYGDTRGKKAQVGFPLRPRNPYAVSKAMVEALGARFRGEQLECLVARAFNHTGPNRPNSYFEAHVAKAAAESRSAGEKSLRLQVGTVQNVRDYSDVRDVVEKYLWIAAAGDAGQAFNVCSGEGRRLTDVCALIERASGVKIELVEDAHRLRRNDLAYLVGEDSFGWTRRPLEETLAELVASKGASS